jgi:shikimate kinase
MTADTNATISRLDLPYKDLILTGFLGVGKTTVGRHIALQLEVDFFDLDEEIELRELMSIAKIREQYGDSHLRMLEYDLCRQAVLMRRAVVVIPGAAMLDPRNARAFADAGQIVCLTCELGEALRRLHLSSDQHYRDATIRRRMLSRMRREFVVNEDPKILQFEVTHLTVEEEADLLIKLWVSEEPDRDRFRYGPLPPRLSPPKNPMGISKHRQPNKSLELKTEG